MNHLKCPLCQSNRVFLYTLAKDYQNRNNTTGYKAYKCPDCCIIFQHPFPSKTDFDDLYPDDYYAHVEDGQIPFLTRLLKSFLQGKHKILAFFTCNSLFPYFDVIEKSHKVLDIGCGKGIFLDVLKSLGKETHGLEPDANAAKILEKHGHQFHRDISEIEDNAFDLVSMFQVFEHIEDPAPLIREIVRILKPGGYFISETPNAASKLAENKNHWRALEFPRHLILHSPKSIEQLFEKENFQTKIWIRVSPTDIRESFFLKRNLQSPVAKKLCAICLLPYTFFQYFFNAKNASLLISVSKKTTGD
jgi:2-polyprenyl-3-methyl-5-hydroxy-6-metoxy-1,4-benzoquinol methylase